ncbi:mutants block sporulation after engulfment [Salipaludibacillus keqinensis]|uniref:Mutants block sporulation after engulfment n=1 Tax=Salipaludibacillus keqinensis TaxID=2045207 RepID=A0A323TII6_9BACI|nr:SpoIIIAH-like family protein [Salipaludibacillus keqinensis]PYZ94350.1 mutants block sporulation after engulfment [Salipaludibacillus keqinensis]
MILKRQTVWLLTMLSLIVVLSVYYMTMDRFQDQQTAGSDMGEEASLDEDVEFEWIEGEDITFVELENVEEVLGDVAFSSQVDAEEMFETIRLQRQDARGRLNEEYKSVIASTETDPEIQVDALEKIESLQVVSQKEEMIETIIRSKGYEDALVMSDNNQVNIYVKASDLTKEQAVELNQLAYEHLGIENIRVGYQAGTE